MTQDLQLTLMYEQGINLCGVTLTGGKQKVLPIEKLNDSELEDMVQEDSLESARLQIDGDLCIINLLAADGQWGRTIVWDYMQDRVIHLTNTPFVQDSVIQDGKVRNRYEVAYWGHPADYWHSEEPLELCDPSYEPELIRDGE